ncbi:tautomerase family protein [Granulicella sp. L60]|uniref:tautomerase family protein n=1 Tax=Granulicella sp. L60 TaxID=1641866 RepID=UPI00131D2B07|nr:tautomerase family protein [Granulicella sp. L60]
MPTYVCQVPAGFLTVPQRSAIAEAISHSHSEATGAPPFFVQVVIEEMGTGVRFLGGELVANHIWIYGHIRAGRTKEQKTKLMLQIMRDVAKVTSLPEESIWVYLNNLYPTDMVEYGHVLPEPGAEQKWFDSLPESLKTYLVGLGTERNSFVL